MDEVDVGTEAGQNSLLIEIHRLAHRLARRRLRWRRKRGEQIPVTITAEDLAQDVVLHCLIGLREGSWNIGSRSLVAHIACLVARREAILRLRRHRFVARDWEHLWESGQSVRPWMEPDVKLTAAQLDEVREATLAKLFPACRRAYLMVREEGLSYATVAERLGVTKSTVKAHVLRAQGAFRSALRSEGIEVAKGRRVAPQRKPATSRRGARPRAASLF